jgi:hypothetical protein
MGSFTDKDKGFKAFMENMRRNDGETSVFAGYLRSSGEYKPKAGESPREPITMAQLGIIHEFGTERNGGHVPERSYLRSTMAEQNKKLKAMIKKLSDKVAIGRIDKKQALGLLGEFLVTAFRNKIQEGVPPPNDPKTIKRKGSEHTLIDTGQMRDTLDWEIQEGRKK